MQVSEKNVIFASKIIIMIVDDIKAGDIVCLNSHPDIPMTVKKANSRFCVTVQWLDAKQKLQEHDFVADQLQPYKPLPRVEIG